MSALPPVLKAPVRTFVGVAWLSAIVNLLHLTGSLFMLEIYDRVLPSRSIPTLIGLAAIVLGLYAFQALFDVIRGRVLSRIGVALDETLGVGVFRSVLMAPLAGKRDGDGQQPLRDLDQVKGFLSGSGPSALFDLPWIPLYLAFCFGFHSLIGLTALGGAVLLVVITLLTELMSRRTTRAVLGAQQQGNVIASAGQRNAEAVHAMGMAARLADRWRRENVVVVGYHQRLSDITGGFGSVSKVVRLLIQSGVLAVGAYLVIASDVTAGVMIASSILAARALAPVELAITNWRGFTSARQSWRRLKEFVAEAARERTRMALPAPKASFSLEGVSGGAPATTRPLVDDINLKLITGDGLGIIGPSASGKSSLARLMVGIWPAWRGRVRLDGAAIDNWSPDSLGGHIGYPPQDVELFSGTIAENISRFEENPDPQKIIAAARAANVHDMILHLPNGYDAPIGDAGAALSGGQRQRIALARALYGDPFLVVLDEPNSNLDNEGEQALTDALLGVRDRGGIVIVIAHRPSALACVDQVLVLADGRVKAIGPKDEILSKLVRSVPRMPGVTPFEVVSSTGGKP